MISAEIMRQQMRVMEQSDARLRKVLTRTLVGQVRPSTPMHRLGTSIDARRVCIHARLKD